MVLLNGTRDRTALVGWKKEEFKDHKLGQYQLLGTEIVKRLSNGKLVELSDLGHVPFYENFKRFEKIFIKEI